ncbi:jg6412 [Pararge aegeria aegeria]|uniref:Jg6412 protein n=1 Tax=Pararge aegeria aegeria TaxID=348720 RepID=A0A8S4SFS8_9NEOP|nr:jg6412 [Pararge aegeria aegeria]
MSVSSSVSGRAEAGTSSRPTRVSRNTYSRITCSRNTGSRGSGTRNAGSRGACSDAGTLTYIARRTYRTRDGSRSARDRLGGRGYVGGELFWVGLYGWLELRNTVYTLSTLLSFSKNGIKSKSSESVMSSNHDATGGGRVVDDDNSAKVAAETVEVFHVVAAVEHAAISEQPRTEYAPSITRRKLSKLFFFTSPLCTSLLTRWTNPWKVEKPLDTSGPESWSLERHTKDLCPAVDVNRLI